MCRPIASVASLRPNYPSRGVAQVRVSELMAYFRRCSVHLDRNVVAATTRVGI
jgi:hypothetical protein